MVYGSVIAILFYSKLVVANDERKYPLDGVAVYYFKLNVKKMLTEDNVHRVSEDRPFKLDNLQIKISLLNTGLDGRHARCYG